MVVNEKETKIMVIMGSAKDQHQTDLGFFTVRHCNWYAYLGVIFTSDANVLVSLKLDTEMKAKQLNRLMIFLGANYDAPFSVKKSSLQKVFEACLLFCYFVWL